MTHNNDDDASSDKEWEDSQNHDNDDDDDDDHHQMPKHDDFVTLLRRLQSPIIFSSSNINNNNNHTAHSSSTNHDPKAIRLAAVTCAILDLIPTTKSKESSSSSTTVTAAQVYAQALTALEGTLKVTTTTTRSTPNNNNNNNDPTTTATTTTDDADTTSMMMKVQMDTWATTIAILELLCQTIPYIATTPGSSNIVGLTLSTFATRIFRAVIQTTTLSSSSSSSLWMPRTALDATEPGGASRTAVLRSVGRTSTILLQHVPRMTKESAVREFLTGTLWTLFYHETPKVRKAAQSGLLEVVLMPTTTTRHASILPTVNAIVQQELQSIMMATNDDDQQHQNQMLQQRSLQLLPFLERTIYYLNYPEITRLIMMYLTSLSQSMIRSNHHHENDYVTTTTGVVVKVQESTFKVRVLASILNLVGTLWQSETNDDATRTAAQLFQHELAPRVMATLLQLKSQFRLITMNRMTMAAAAVEYETSVETTRLFGHVLLTACHNVSLQNDDDTNWETYCTLLPLSIQAVLQLCQPPPTPHATAAGPHHRHRTTTTTTIPQTALFMELTQLIRTKMPLLVDRMESSSTTLSKLITKCCHDVLSCMKQVLLGDSTYSSTWSVSLPMMSILIQHVHSIMPHEEMASIIESFIVLHNDSTTTTKGKQDIENAWSTLFQGVGIETLWSWIAWTDPNHRHDSSTTTTTTVSKSKSNDNMIISYDRAWILSILKTPTNHTSGGRAPRLEFFQHHVLALARQCDTLSKQSSPLPSQKQSPVCRTARTRVIDLWNLFPCFCSPLPCDLVQALPSLNVTLVRVLEDKRYPELLVGP